MYSVFIVDNEAIIRKGLRLGFDWEGMGCRVAGEAADGEEALEKMKAQPPDILISDIRMPGMDGLTLTKRVRERFPDTQVILVTAFGEFEYAQEALHQQVADFIIKPTSREKMKTAIARASALLDAQKRDREMQRTLKEKHEDNLALRQRLFLEGVLSGGIRSDLYVREEGARLRIDLLGRRAVYIRILPDDAEDAAGVYAEEVKGYLSPMFAGETAIFLSAGDSALLALAPGREPHALVAALEEAAEMIDSMTEFGVQMGVSGAMRGAAQLRQAAQEARDACYYLDYDGGQAVMLFEQIPRVSPEGGRQLRDRLEDINRALRRRDRAFAEEALRALDRTVQAEKFPLEEVRRSMVLLYSMCVHSLADVDLKTALEAGLLPDEGDFLRRVEKEGPLPAGLAMLDVTLRSMEGDGGQEGPVARLQAYLANHFAENLSLDAMAAMVHLSPGYLSREFKRAAGCTIGAYVSALRVERAKELLKNGAMKNADIGQAVGIEDPVYFSRMFKKATGLRPSEYRDRARAAR